MSKYILVIFLFCSCSVGFKRTSIPAEVKTFTVENVIDNSYNAPSTYPTDFQVALSNKIRRESKLKANDRDPDLTYKVSISNFAVSSQAPVSGAVSSSPLPPQSSGAAWYDPGTIPSQTADRWLPGQHYQAEATAYATPRRVH